MSPNPQPKFLVDLKQRVFLSDKPHQDIIDEHGLDPAGYDNYFKGWVNGHDAKVWVEQVEDLAFRYWDQARTGFRKLVSEKILTPRSRTIAVVNNSDRTAGTVADFLGLSNAAYADAKLGRPAYADLLPGLKAGAKFRLLSTVRIGTDRYLPRGVEGRLLKDVKGHPPRLEVRWAKSVSGTNRPKAAVSQAMDVRVLLPIG
jgi:hypothetical protein